MTTWIERWRDTIAAEPELPGVWKRRDGGFLIRARATDPRNGRVREVRLKLPDCKKPREAAAILESKLDAIRAGTTADAPQGPPTFAAWAATVMERKIANGDIASASGRAKWDWALRVHLIPAFGDVFIDKLSREEVERWKAALLAPREKAQDEKRDRKLRKGKYLPGTCNTVLEILRQITGAASDEFNIADPCRSLANVDKRGHRTYTYEEPNALKPEDVPRFLAEFRARFPQHYAFVFLGFTTGLRPSSLRPLRRSGSSADIKWDDGKLIVRRSHTHKSEIMDWTKTAADQVIALDPEQVSVLRWHCDRLDRENERRAHRSPHLARAMASSELLFPAEPNGRTNGGGLRTPSCLDKAFAEVGNTLKLGYAVTPRSMRRTYQDLARAAQVKDVVTRAISGHATETMQRHYSSVSDAEVREGLAAVIDIATGRRRAA